MWRIVPQRARISESGTELVWILYYWDRCWRPRAIPDSETLGWEKFDELATKLLVADFCNRRIDVTASRNRLRNMAHMAWPWCAMPGGVNRIRRKSDKFVRSLDRLKLRIQTRQERFGIQQIFLDRNIARHFHFQTVVVVPNKHHAVVRFQGARMPSISQSTNCSGSNSLLAPFNCIKHDSVPFKISAFVSLVALDLKDFKSRHTDIEQSTCHYLLRSVKPS